MFDFINPHFAGALVIALVGSAAKFLKDISCARDFSLFQFIGGMMSGLAAFFIQYFYFKYKSLDLNLLYATSAATGYFATEVISSVGSVLKKKIKEITNGNGGKNA